MTGQHRHWIGDKLSLIAGRFTPRASPLAIKFERRFAAT
jgi:hypothetical protein